MSFCTVVLTGCTGLTQQQTLADLQANLGEVRTDLQRTTGALKNYHKQESVNQAQLVTQIDTLQEKLLNVSTELAQTCRKSATSIPIAVAPKCPTQPEPVVLSSSDKLVLGELERIQITAPNFSLVARMDTGASSSSLHAKNLQTFERDGEDWVRFNVDTDDGDIAVEKPVVKFVRVFQQADKQGSRRPVVSLRLQLGNIQDSFEFTLADRSHLEHPMILGRNFLTDMAVVDVSQQFLQPDP